MAIADEFGQWLEQTPNDVNKPLITIPDNPITDAIGRFVEKAKQNWNEMAETSRIANDIGLANSDMYLDVADNNAARAEQKFINETVKPPVYAAAMTAAAVGGSIPIVSGAAAALFLTDITASLRKNTNEAEGNLIKGAGNTLLDFTPFYRLGEHIANDPAAYYKEVQAQPAEAAWDIGMNLLATFLIGRGFMPKKKGASASEFVTDALKDRATLERLTPDELEILYRMERVNRKGYAEEDLVPATKEELQQTIGTLLTKISQEKWDMAESRVPTTRENIMTSEIEPPAMPRRNAPAIEINPQEVKPAEINTEVNRPSGEIVVPETSPTTPRSNTTINSEYPAPAEVVFARNRTGNTEPLQPTEITRGKYAVDENGKLYGGLSGLDELGKRFFGKVAVKTTSKSPEVNKVIDSITQPKEKTLSDWVAEKTSKLAEHWLDDKTDIATVDKIMAQEKGRPLTADEKMYNAIHLAVPKANSEIQLLLYGKMKEYTLMKADSQKAVQAIRNNREGVSLNDTTFKDVFEHLKTQADKDLFDAYSIAKQAVDAIKEHPDLKMPKGLTVQDFIATQKFIEANHKNVVAAHKKAMEVKANMMALSVHDGIVSPELAKMLQEKYPNHVPMYRDMGDLKITDDYYSNSGGFFNVKDTVKSYAGGSETRIFMPPLESMIMNLVRERSIGNKNAAARKIIDMAEAHPWIAQMEGIDTSTGQPIQMAGNYRSTNPEVKSFNVKIDGERYSFSTSRELYDAINSMDPQAINLLAKVLDVPYSLLKAGATGLNPEFILKNIARDTTYAGVTSDNFTPGATTAKGAKSAISSKQSLYDYFAGGGGMETLLSADRMSITQKSREMIMGKGTGKYLGAATDLLGTLGNYSEIASRLGAYEAELAASGNRTAATVAGRTSTVDFLVAGKTARQVNQVVPFFNAAIQGQRKLLAYAQENPKAFVAKGIAYVTIPTLILKALFGDDDRIKDLPQYEKDLFWIFPVGEGDTLVRIPKPPALGFLFGTLPERMIDMAIEENPAIAKQILGAFWRDVTPPLGLPGLQQFAEWQANYNFFQDMPIVSKKYEGLPDKLQYDTNTSEVAKIIGSAFEVSPMKVDNTIRGAAAGLGKIATDTVDLAVGDENRPEKKWQEMPLARAVFKLAGKSSQSAKDFWDRYTDLKEKYNADRQKMEPMTPEDKAEYNLLNKYAEKIKELNKKEAAIHKKQMDSATKRMELDKLRDKYHALTQEAMQK